ncbi:MAG: DNA repair exonuclease [Pseudomonadota bacterium]
MPQIKFIHAADVHLDSPLVGLARYPGAPVEAMRGATRQALRNLTELAVSEEVSFVLLAGDLYDGDWRDYNTGLFFASRMRGLAEAGIRVFAVAGNHDAASQMTRHLRLPQNVHLFSSREAETIDLPDLGVAVHGRSFPVRAVTEDLSADYPLALPHTFNIGLLHTCGEGRSGHDPYAPCSLSGLLSKGYDYWALGHVHQREVLHENPWVVFSGNIQGRHARETGAKGCTLVTVEDGRVTSVEHRELDVLRWSQCRVDASGADTGDDLLSRVTQALEAEQEAGGGRPLAVRLRISGPCRAHAELGSATEHWLNEIRAAAAELSGPRVFWLEEIILETQAATDLEAMLARDDALGSLLRGIDGWAMDEENLRAEVLAELGSLRHKLPAELRLGDDAPDLTRPEGMSWARAGVKQLILARLLDKGEAG